MVHKGPPDILHTGYQLDIGYENDDSYYALQYGHHCVGMDESSAYIGDKQGKHHENANCHNKGKYHNHCHERALQLLAEDLIQPRLKFTGLCLLVVLKKTAGPGEGPHAHYHGIYKTENTSYKGKT